MMMTHTHNISRVRVWILASRPHTLPAAMAPVLVGTAMAIADKGFRFLPALAAMAGALLLQISVNLANDYFDYTKGVDTSQRLGPVRVTQSGLIPPARVKAAIIVTLGLAAAVGVYLIYAGGWPILLIGLASILSLLAYSGGPYPLASHGLGDLFVFIFFGPVAVSGTYYVQTLYLTWQAILVAIPVGLLITAILVINNLRDINTDHQAGKYTLAVILGDRGARIEYVLLLASAYAMPGVFWLTGLAPRWVLLPVISLPIGLYIIRFTWLNTGPQLNQALAGTAGLSLLFSLLLSIGIILSS